MSRRALPFLLGLMVVTIVGAVVVIRPWSGVKEVEDFREEETPELTSVPVVVKEEVTEEAVEVNEATPSPKPDVVVSQYPIHRDIVATVFWVGEGESADNDFISNRQSAWDSDWVGSFGGVDTPDERDGWYPKGFAPLENPFYVALPYSDFDESGRKDDLHVVPWNPGGVSGNQSIIKNRWVKIDSQDKTCFAQWEDVGPFFTDDVDYVFGNARSKNTFGEGAGIDISPAVRDCLKVGPSSIISWQFVDDGAVENGPWKEIVTTSQTKRE